MPGAGRWSARAATLVGLAVSFVAGVNLVRAVRLPLLLDPEPSWAVARLFLGLGLIAGVLVAGGAAAGAFLLWSRSWLSEGNVPAFPLSRNSLMILAAAAIGLGILLRGAWIARLPIPFLEDEVNLITPALELSGTPRDFSNSVRPIPYGVRHPHEVVGVLYLYLFRWSLRLLGPTVTGVRFLSLLGGGLSLLTAALLARVLLPRGGAALAALVLAGLRWHLILSLSGWNSILLAPIVDVATLWLLRSRRGRHPVWAVAAGFLMGIGPHLYLAAWVAAAALLGFSLWPSDSEESRRARVRRALLFVGGFLLAAAPLFVLREGRMVPYFHRTAAHSIVREMQYARSALPLFAVAADALAAPWWIPEPEGRHDLPGHSRLGWVVGIPVAVALSRSLLSPRRELSGLLLLHAGAAFAAAVVSGQAGHPNGFRFGYLTTVTAVAAAGGLLALVGLVGRPNRRPAAILAIGLLAVSGALGARDALLLWPGHRATFQSFHGEDTLLGRAAARWERYGSVRVASGLGRSDLTIDTVRRYRLDSDRGTAAAAGRQRSLRLAAPGASASPGERIVEQVRDGWGREWGVVLGRLTTEK